MWAPETLAFGTRTPPEGDEGVSPHRASIRIRDKFKGKYANPNSTSLHASINPDTPNRFTFELE